MEPCTLLTTSAALVASGSISVVAARVFFARFAQARRSSRRSSNHQSGGVRAAGCRVLEIIRQECRGPPFEEARPKPFASGQGDIDPFPHDSVLESPQDSVRPGHVEPDGQQRFVQR